VRDYYEILQVHPEASIETIVKCYRIQIKKNHPDINKALDAREKTILINQAYEVLSDPVKRAQYNIEYFNEIEPEFLKPRQRKIVFRSFLCWVTMLGFILADILNQIFVKNPAPVSQTIFFLFLIITAIRDGERTIVLRVAWVIGVYILWVVLQGAATFVVWKYGIRAPMALAVIVVSQCPALWFVMRRASLFFRTVSP